MTCRSVRRRLAAKRVDAAVERHLESCPACAAYGARHESVLQALGEHHAEVKPTNGFSARVQARLVRGDDPIGWAAVRLLPASLALILLLSWLNLRTSDITEPGLSDPTTAMLSWALESPIEAGEGGR